MNLENSGTKLGKIPVLISYRIIELFSAGLYSSPNKAFEELVSNSYDAYAHKVSVFVPSDTSISNAYMWVCDNGKSMDRDGLKLLWKIGSSTKRNAEEEESRLQIGKFGIGKLATYVLARKLTYICKDSKGDYLAVTMDYTKIGEDVEEIELDERRLTLEEVKAVVKPYIMVDGRSQLSFDLWGENGEDTWTFSIMTELQPKASEISEGRLKWVLRTALPLNPDFKLHYNGSVLEPSKLDRKPINTWIIGENDTTCQNFPEYKESVDSQNRPVVDFEYLKGVRGEIQLFEDSMVSGKSEKWGRSHGIFLMVRERLVNVTDPLLGLDALSHGTFNRTRIIIHADELDENLTSTRESIKESRPLAQLREYVKRKFVNEVRAFWLEHQESEKDRDRASTKLFTSSGSLSRRPLLAMVRKYFAGEISSLMFSEIPANLSKDEKKTLLKNLEDDLTDDKGIIKDVVVWEVLAADDPVAKFDLVSGKAKINMLHPFFANFSDEIKTTLPFELIALTEILTEAHLFELGVDQEVIRQILTRRDQLLRQFTFSDRPNAPGVATMLRDSLADSVGLEKAVFHAFNNLGYDTTPMGKKGKPDGRASALLGYRTGRKNAQYSLVYDAKSTGKEKIKAATARVSASDRHRDAFEADYAVVVAPDFEGADIEDSAVNLEAKKLKVTLIRAKDFIKLLMLSAPKQIGLVELEELFKTCHKVFETEKWISSLSKKEVTVGPIKELLEAVFAFQKDEKEPPVVDVIRYKMTKEHGHLKDLSVDDIKTLVDSLQRLVPGYISFDNNIVSLNAKPEKVLDSITHVTSHDIPPEFREAYLNAFE